MKKGLIILMLGLIFQIGFSQTETEKNFEKYFDKYGVKGCFVLYNQTDNEYIKYNTDLCDTGFLPASTFKIPNSLIALEEKLILDTNQVIKWNGHVYPRKELNQDQTLKTAMKYSCVWVHVGFAEQLGIDKYKEYIRAFDYGNKNLTGPPTYFWLAGDFKISANQQIEFLKNFYNYDLLVTKKSIDIVKDIIILEQTENYKLSGKTGTILISENEYIMWLVGYIEKDGKPYFYAMNFKTDDYSKYMQSRFDIAKSIFRELKLVE